MVISTRQMKHWQRKRTRLPERVSIHVPSLRDGSWQTEWEAAVARTASILDISPPSIPYPASSSKSTSTSTTEPTSTTKSKGKGKKRTKAEMEEEETAKKAKTSEEQAAAASSTGSGSAQAGLSHDFLAMLDPESLKHPTLPSVDDMSKVLLEVRKNALRAEYGV
jgi:pre-mRNA-splicing factor ISY1